MENNIVELIDFERINSLLEGFSKSTGFVFAILDLKGNVLSQSGWRKICSDFHRVNPQTRERCLTSDTILASEMASGEKYHYYRCLNGLVDVAVPVVINGEHIANLFTGQFFFESPDPDYFARQAKKYGFDEKVYLEQLKEVPVVTQEKVKTTIEFLLKMTELMADMTIQRKEQIQLNNSLQHNQLLLEAQNRELQQAKDIAEKNSLMHSSILHTSMDGFLLVNAHMHLVEVNDAYLKMSGYNKQELLNMSLSDLEARETLGETHKQIEKIKITGSGRFITCHRRKDGSTFDAEITMHCNPVGDGHLVVFIRDITERIKAREEIEKSERIKTDLLVKFNEAQQSAKIGNWDWYLVPNTIWWSDEMYRIFDLVPGEYTPSRETNSKYLHPDDRIHYQEQVMLAIKNNTELNEDLRIISAAGTLKYCNSRAKLECDGQGNPVRLYGTLADVTEQKKVERSLQQSEERLSKIFHSSPSAIVLSDLNSGKFLEMNEAATRLYGFSREELIGHTSMEMGIIEPEERKKLMIALASQGSLKGYELVIQSRYEGLRMVFCFMEILTIDDRQCMLTSMVDITERKRAEEALAHSEKELRTLAESMPQIVWITQPDGQNIYFNQQWVNYSGLSLEESYGDGWILPFHPEDKETARVAWLNAVFNNGSYSIECRIRRKDGIYRWFLIRGVPVYDDSGMLVKWFGTCTDIEEIKAAEDKIKDQLDELRRWHEVTIDREDRILELKSEVNELLMANGMQARYGNNHYPTNHE